MTVFLDTGYFIAFLVPRDQWFELADAADIESVHCVTSSQVVNETLSLLQARGLLSAALDWLQGIRANPDTEILYIDPVLQSEAWDLFHRWGGSGATIVDCASFAIMRRLHIKKAFTFDRHFRTAGFENPSAEPTNGSPPAVLKNRSSLVTAKTFYLETFGCQMNAHDSEKVVGTLLARGYTQVETPEAAELVLYNTCSIRDKAEQKVFHRLQQFKRAAGKGKVFGVLGCVAQQEGEKIFDKAPHVSLVAGSASYTKLPEMLVQLEAGARRVTGLSLDTDETFDTPFTRRDNPHRAYITIIEGCDKSCAYCVVPFTRGPERSRTSASVLTESRQLAELGYTEIQLLGQNVNSYRDPSPAGWDFATLLARVGEIEGIRRVRFTTSHPRDFVKQIVDAIDENPRLCNHVHLPVQSGSDRMLSAMQRLYTRDQYMRRIEWLKNSPRNIAITTDIIVGFPGETEADFLETLALLDQVQYDSLFSFKYSPRPNTAALAMGDHIPEEEKTRRLTILQERQRAIQIQRNSETIGAVQEVHVEGRNSSLGQWIGRTSQNRTLNFVDAGEDRESLIGKYLPVRVTRAGPNSLAGESAVNML